MEVGYTEVQGIPINHPRFYSRLHLQRVGRAIVVVYSILVEDANGTVAQVHAHDAHVDQVAGLSRGGIMGSFE